MKTRIRIPAELRDLAPQYLESRKRDLPVLKDALTRKDFDLIGKLSHQMKGMAGSYGFPELGDLAKTLELAANSRNEEDLSAGLEAVTKHLESLEIIA